MRIGFFGGTFNPVHNGHLALAQEAKDILGMDKVIFIPAYIPPHKSTEALVDAKDRFRMLELAISAKKGFEISCCEIEKQDKSYSIDTLRHFRDSYPEDTEFLFLIGADSLSTLNTWKDIDKLFKLCKFTAANRPGFSTDTEYDGIEIIKIKPADISSSEIRRKIKNGEDVKGLMPQAVEDYIKTRNLYKR